MESGDKMAAEWRHQRPLPKPQSMLAPVLPALNMLLWVQYPRGREAAPGLRMENWAVRTADDS
ncbi:hypothetical protein DDT56_08040 [Brenneria corticis]|uniref:Uncharacterized protein n=1 Tax=Brenneria corticis TaxID=2173106 RepID=A0A2U1U712_9GAMM|nr:hypothetical protein DDT56_08040 [Brenneria sp. CFCC 11842]